MFSLNFITDFHTQMIYFLLTVLFLVFLSAAVGDGGAQWMDSHLSDESGKKLMSFFHF